MASKEFDAALAEFIELRDAAKKAARALLALPDAEMDDHVADVKEYVERSVYDGPKNPLNIEEHRDLLAECVAELSLTRGKSGELKARSNAIKAELFDRATELEPVELIAMFREWNRDSRDTSGAK